MRQALIVRYRISLGIFVLGLILSGLTAFPLLTELRLVAAALGIVNPAEYQSLTGLQHWIALFIGVFVL